MTATDPMTSRALLTTEAGADVEIVIPVYNEEAYMDVDLSTDLDALLPLVAPLLSGHSNSAAGYQLASGDPVMAIGGFNGTDPAPTLAQFKTWVAAGAIHYFIAGGGFGAGQNQNGDYASQIASWVETNFGSQTIGGVTLYNLTVNR